MLSTDRDEARWDRENRQARADFAKVDTYLCRAPARLRRASAEAHEIAYRDAHRRRPVPDNEFFDSVDAEIAKPQLWATAPFWIAFLALAGFVAGLLIGQIDRRAAIDFIAPTAAQAREAGWVAISEAL